MIYSDKIRVVALLLCLAFFNAYAQTSPGSPAWDSYHSSSETVKLIRRWTTTYPELTKLYSIGKTLKGTDLMVLEITNKSTGAAKEKPGYYYDGNIHAGELTGAEVALHFAWYVLSNYQSNIRIKDLLDTHVLYIRPKFNPDGADIALSTPNHLRSTPRPYDEDGDGLLDEDPGDDLNGDGFITQMRVESVNGKWQLSKEDPRLLVRRTADNITGPFYDLYKEGIDDDQDGLLNEDGLGGIDMNRNFPRNWGMEFEQKGAGPYPLSEPETRATIEFLSTHRNITGVFHGHTSGGFLFRLPSTTSWDDYDLRDQQLILELSDQYAKTTGQPVRPSYSNPKYHRHGTLISWSYWDFGVPAFVPEFWRAGKDYDNDGRVSDEEKLKWNDNKLDGEGFVKWSVYYHPQLGNVEIGGWKRKFTLQNPPPSMLKKEIEKYVPWMLWLAEISPKIEVIDIHTETVGKSGMVKVTATIQNTGYLPTNITQRALDNRTAQPVRVFFTLDGATVVAGKPMTVLGHLAGSRGANGPADSSRKVEFVVHPDGKNPKAFLKVVSEKGGTVMKEINLN